MSKKQAQEIKAILLAHYQGAKSELQFANLYELIVCVMLSAQCTDKRVNLITPALFAQYPDIASLSSAPLYA
ncbi:MAG: endonuclease III, partial [Helicobacter sp.]|nr:endonuclease III [Helicobacter sp.]